MIILAVHVTGSPSFKITAGVGVTVTFTDEGCELAVPSEIDTDSTLR